MICGSQVQFEWRCVALILMVCNITKSEAETGYICMLFIACFFVLFQLSLSHSLFMVLFVSSAKFVLAVFEFTFLR